MVVSATEDRSKVMVLSASLAEPLVRVAGAWAVGTFSADELKDSFERVTDTKEAEMLLHEASAALESNSNLPIAESHAS